MRHNLCRITRERMLAGCCCVVSEQRASPHVGHSLWCLVNLAGRIECGVAIAAQNVAVITARGGGQRVGRNQALRTLVGAAAAGHAFNSAHSEVVDVKLQQQVVVSADSYELASEPRLYTQGPTEQTRITPNATAEEPIPAFKLLQLSRIRSNCEPIEMNIPPPKHISFAANRID